jgi:50S ribosomal protein L16 3-hydroxylase
MTGGGVGAHVDNYDVFLVQGGGRREWSIENTFLSQREERAREVRSRIREGDAAGTRVLHGFATDQSWVLEPGDMLYLPPRGAFPYTLHTPHSTLHTRPM